VPSALFEPAIPAVKRLLRLRPHGHRNRPSYVLVLLNKTRNKQYKEISYGECVKKCPIRDRLTKCSVTPYSSNCIESDGGALPSQPDQ